jgi:hypothetical protein
VATTEWKPEWGNPDDPTYEWPVTPSPDSAVVDQLGKDAIALGGRAVKDAHADRGVVMDFPNKAVPGVKVRKQVPRAECRRRAQIMAPLPPDTAPASGTPPRDNSDPLKVCVVCDAVHLWPAATAGFVQ